MLIYSYLNMRLRTQLQILYAVAVGRVGSFYIISLFWWASSSGLILRMSQLYFHLLVQIWVLTICNPDILFNSSLLIQIGQYIFSTILRQVWTNTSILCSSASVIQVLWRVIPTYSGVDKETHLIENSGCIICIWSLPLPVIELCTLFV